jgi:hypothetical protein
MRGPHGVKDDLARAREEGPHRGASPSRADPLLMQPGAGRLRELGSGRVQGVRSGAGKGFPAHQRGGSPASASRRIFATLSLGRTLPRDT